MRSSGLGRVLAEAALAAGDPLEAEIAAGEYHNVAVPVMQCRWLVAGSIRDAAEESRSDRTCAIVGCPTDAMEENEPRRPV